MLIAPFLFIPFTSDFNISRSLRKFPPIYLSIKLSLSKYLSVLLSRLYFLLHNVPWLDDISRHPHTWFLPFVRTNAPDIFNTEIIHRMNEGPDLWFMFTIKFVIIYEEQAIDFVPVAFVCIPSIGRK